ncbi:MAG TPA: hypothetical protein VF832_07520 [Longimicrobiales bacterium]
MEQSKEPRTGWGRSAAGVDASPERRPGVPMYARGIRRPDLGGSGVKSGTGSWGDANTAPGEAGTIPRQGDDPRHLKRLGLGRLTPVYGTANPPHGVSGAMRRWAYRYPEDLARHWMLLLMADRVDVVEDRLGGLLERPLASAGFSGVGRTVRRNPVGALAITFGGLWLAKRLLK